MVRVLTLFIFFIISFVANAYDIKSAHREPSESYLDLKFRAALFSTPQYQGPFQMVSAQSAAGNYGSVALPNAVTWESQTVLLERFRTIRDTRWLVASDHPGFLRRNSWLYPDDGCYARAALAGLKLARLNVPPPSKIFVFGDLTLFTKNSPVGAVSWWYHVASVVQVGGQKYVLDPAVDPDAPLKIEVWLARLNPNIARLEVAICGSGAYTPSDACAKVSDGVETQANSDVNSYLVAEWSRILELGRDPNQDLGAKPPWL